MSQENVEVVRTLVPYYRDTAPLSEAAGMATTFSRA